MRPSSAAVHPSNQAAVMTRQELLGLRLRPAAGQAVASVKLLIVWRCNTSHNCCKVASGVRLQQAGESGSNNT